jgi:hypothetical protein
MPTTQDTKATTKPRHKDGHAESGNGHAAALGGHAYVVPVVHLSLPESAVNVGFWSVLVGSVALGAVDFPLAALIGVGVLVARHRRSG